jgi:hypothetical protein
LFSQPHARLFTSPLEFAAGGEGRSMSQRRRNAEALGASALLIKMI